MKKLLNIFKKPEYNGAGTVYGYSPIRQHFYWYKWIYIIVLAIALPVGALIWYEYKYPCVYGHYEDSTCFMYIDNIAYPYSCTEFICDCRTTRDSIK